MIESWWRAGKTVEPSAPVDPVDPELIETQRQLTVLEQRIDRLVDGYRRAGEAYRRR
jgi:hypothetical protein